MPPFTTLPHILIPRASSKCMPPIMHYGWSADIDFLFKYAQKHGLTRYCQDYVIKDDDDQNIQQINVVDECNSAGDALRHIVERIEGSSPRRGVGLEAAIQSHDSIVVSLFTNYTLPYAPTHEFKRQLREKLGLTDEPKWYLDSLYWHWQSEIPECMAMRGSGLYLV